MKEVYIDFVEIGDEEDFYAQLKEKLALPEHFGDNLDALYDVMSERIDASATTNTTNQLWLIRSLPAQEKMLYPIFDTLRDALSQSSGITLTLLWWINE